MGAAKFAMPFGHTPASWANTLSEQVCDYRADGRCALPDAQLPKSTILPWGNPSATVAFLLTRAEARQRLGDGRDLRRRRCGRRHGGLEEAEVGAVVGEVAVAALLALLRASGR